MKKLFSTSLLAMLCCMVNLSFSQNDTPARNPKTGSKQPNFETPRFDIEEDLRLMALLTSALEKEGLINKSASYKLEIKDGGFSINDIKQSKGTTDKYSQYFRRDKTDNYTILSNGDCSTSTSNQYKRVEDQPKRRTSHSESETIWFDPAKYRNDLTLMNQLISGLEKEGLLDSKKSYRLEVRVAELHINGKKQSQDIANKFRKYFHSNNYALINN